LEKMFKRDAAAAERFNSDGFMSSVEEFKAFTGDTGDQRENNFGSLQDFARPPAASPAYGSFGSWDDGQSRQNGDPAGAFPGDMRAWDPPASRASPSSSFSTPDQLDSSRAAVPDRPVNLPMPRRPGNPGNPF